MGPTPRPAGAAALAALSAATGALLSLFGAAFHAVVAVCAGAGCEWPGGAGMAASGYAAAAISAASLALAPALLLGRRLAWPCALAASSAAAAYGGAHAYDALAGGYLRAPYALALPAAAASLWLLYRPGVRRFFGRAVT